MGNFTFQIEEGNNRYLLKLNSFTEQELVSWQLDTSVEMYEVVLLRVSGNETTSFRALAQISTFGGKAKRKKNLFRKPFADETVADLTAYQVEMFEYRRSRIQVIIIHFCYRQHEIYELVVTLIQARQHRLCRSL